MKVREKSGKRVDACQDLCQVLLSKPSKTEDRNPGVQTRLCFCVFCSFPLLLSPIPPPNHPSYPQKPNYKIIESVMRLLRGY